MDFKPRVTRKHLVAFKASVAEHKKLTTLAKLNNTTVSEVVRTAISNHLNITNDTQD